MNLKKYIIPGCLAMMAFGLGSCVGDLNLEPNDPNLANTDAPDFKENTLGICYSGIACSGISGPGSSYVGGLDAGTSAYLRMMYTLNEFCSDEMVWIWPDAGVQDIVSCTWAANNGLLQGAYYRLVGHIALCNQFLKNTADEASDPETFEMRAEAKVLRAYSYYNMLDLFGQSSFIDDTAEEGAYPQQVSREWLFNWLENELKTIVDNKEISSTPIYGRVGLDGAEGLLARLYLNAEVFSGTARWKDCAQRCENIIARHQGKGFNGTGLAEHYLYLFCRDNNSYMPGGDDVNEILFGIAFDDTYTQSYGGPTFTIASTISDTHYCPKQLYGCSSEWSCIRGIKQMSERFEPNSSGDNLVIGNNDVRDDLWLRGGVDVFPAGSKDGVDWASEDYQDNFVGFNGDWKTVGGNAIIKFTGRTRNAAKDGGWNMTQNADGTYNLGFDATSFASTDQPIIRLADVYLMYTECYIHDRSSADQTKALQYINNVRARAKAPLYGAHELSIQNLMDERSRELYHEMTRRTDLVRNGMFTGPTQTVWQYKGSIDSNEGTRISDKFSLYPIPSAVIAAQPEFKQNPGY